MEYKFRQDARNESTVSVVRTYYRGDYIATATSFIAMLCNDQPTNFT